ncbi:MAG: hypothetical protein AAF960_27680 [Bacteroidota bacterium]
MRNEMKWTLIVSVLMLGSCVSIDKYNELAQVKDYLEQENKRLNSEMNKKSTLEAKNRQNQIELDKLEAEKMELKASFESLNRNYQDLASRYNNLIASNRQISSGSASEKQYWEETLAKKQLELEDRLREIQTLRFTINQKDKRVQELLELLRKPASDSGN